MTGLALEISGIKREKLRIVELDKSTQVALAEYLRDRWPSNTAKMAAREFGLTLDRARGAVGYSATLTTYDQIKKAGGWPVIFAVEARVIGHGADQFLIELRASHNEQSQRLDALLGHGRALSGPRDHDPAGVDHAQGERRIADRRGVGSR